MYRRLNPYLAVLFAAAAVLVSMQHVQAQSISIVPMWSIATTENRSYVVSTNDNQRGVSYNRFTGNAYIVSHVSTGPSIVAIVDGQTGADIGVLGGAVSGGFFALNQIGVAQDSNIYAANLTVGSASGTSPFKIYRWSVEESGPVVVFSGNPMADAGGASLRFGDQIDVRGSGTNTEIVASTGGANATNVVAIFRPTDSSLNTFTNRIIYIPAAGLSDFKVIAFGPTNTFIGKNTGNATLRLCRYDYAAGTGTIINTYTVNSSIAALSMDTTNGLLAGVATANATTPHQLMVYDMSGVAPVLIYTNNFPPPATAGPNLAAGVDIAGDRIIAVDARNGVQMARINIDTTPVAPGISVQPSGATIVQGGYSTITVGVTGSKPLSYQWRLNDVPVSGGTNAVLVFTNVPLSAAGPYYVIATNSAGAATSSVVNVTITPTTLSRVLTPIWKIAPGDVTWMTADNNQRGVAYNGYRDHVLVVTRTPVTAIQVLDAATGTFLHSMSIAGISGGTFSLNMIACTTDGQIFAGNLVTDGTTSPFKLWWWPGDEVDDLPQLAWSGDPGAGVANRWGDSLDVRGTADSVQAIIGSRNGRVVALLDGLYPPPSPFPATVVTVADADAGNFGLSVAFGEGNTFWGKSSGTALRQASYDGSVVRVITNYPAMATVTVHPVNQWLAGISVETPDNVRLLDLEAGPGDPFNLDTKFFGTDNANANGTGELRFGVNRLFALDSNNGLVAYSVWPKLRRSVSGRTLTLNWDGSHTLQASPSPISGWTNVVTGASSYSTTIGASPQLFYRIAD